MFTITKEFHCCSSHALKGLPEEHPCSNVHGHNYVIKVELKSKSVNEIGFVKDYRKLADIKEWIDKNMDHKHLNDVFDFNPTAENMACYLAGIFQYYHPELSAIEISETPKTNARYELNND